MYLEVGSPASLPLGLARIASDEGDKLSLFGTTIQHPPTHLMLEAKDHFQVVGARANKALEYVTNFLAYHDLPKAVQIEIESTIPMFVGLGSDAMLALSVAKGLAWRFELPEAEREPFAMARALGLEAHHALEVAGFEAGGVMLTDTETLAPPLRRTEITYEHERDAWAFVLLLPDGGDDWPDDYEEARLQAIFTEAAPHVSAESGQAVEALWQAINADDFDGFAQALTTMQTLTDEALAAADLAVEPVARQEEFFAAMREGGAAVCGRSLTGLCLYAFVNGAKATIDLRTKLRHTFGFGIGTLVATTFDIKGANQMERDGSLDHHKALPIRPVKRS